LRITATFLDSLMSWVFFSGRFVDPFRGLCVFSYKYTQKEIVQMKKTLFYTVFTLLALSLLADAALAGQVARRQATQQERIQQGISSGSLTAVEAPALNMEQRHIRMVKKRFLAEGVLTRVERRKLGILQEKADDHIRRLKHNRKVTPPRHARGSRPKLKGHHLAVAAGHPLGRPV
jgi:hypothetical protein